MEESMATSDNTVQDIIKSFKSNGIDAPIIKHVIGLIPDNIEQNPKFVSETIQLMNQLNITEFSSGLKANPNLGKDLGQALFDAKIINKSEQQKLETFGKVFNGLDDQSKSPIAAAFKSGNTKL